MSDKGSSDGGKLVVSSSGTLAVASSAALAKRGLDLLEVGKQSLRLVIGDYESNMGDMFVKMVQGAGSYEPSTFCANDVDILMNHAKSEAADMFIVVLNNLVSGGRTFAASLPSPHEAALKFVRDLKLARRKPIIAVSGSDYSGLLTSDAVLAAGADSFSWLPIQREMFIQMVRRSLSVDRRK